MIQDIDENTHWNPETGRCVKFLPFSIACYQGEVRDGVYHGDHAGLIRSGDWDDCIKWMNGDDTVTTWKIQFEVPK